MGSTETLRQPIPREEAVLYEDCLNTSFITEQKVKWSIDSFKGEKAAGPDGIKPIVLKHCGPNMIKRLTQLLQASIHLGYVPSALRTSKVVFIPKPGKTDYTAPKSYRPISLTSCIFKVMEKVILQEVESTSLAEKPLNTNQHAFRKGRAVIQLYQTWLMI